MLPALAGYMGQMGVGSTERYLLLTPERLWTQLDELSQCAERRDDVTTSLNEVSGEAVGGHVFRLEELCLFKTASLQRAIHLQYEACGGESFFCRVASSDERMALLSLQAYWLGVRVDEFG